MLLALSPQKAAGDANGDGQDGDQREQSSERQRRGANGAPIADETFDDEHPKVQELVDARLVIFRVKAFVPDGEDALLDSSKLRHSFRHAWENGNNGKGKGRAGRGVKSSSFASSSSKFTPNSEHNSIANFYRIEYKRPDEGGAEMATWETTKSASRKKDFQFPPPSTLPLFCMRKFLISRLIPLSHS